MKHTLRFNDIDYPVSVDKEHPYDLRRMSQVNWNALKAHLQEAALLLNPLFLTNQPQTSIAWNRCVASHKVIKDLIDAIENGER